eukprot:15356670-Ditylum_brightwellii.AAC.2
MLNSKRKTRSSSLSDPAPLLDLPADIKPTSMPILTPAPDPLVLQTIAPMPKLAEARSLPPRPTYLL